MNRNIAQDLLAALEKALESLQDAEQVIQRIADKDERDPLHDVLTSVMADLFLQLQLPVLRQFPELNRPEPSEPDRDLSEQQQREVAGLTPADLDLIDHTLLSSCALVSLKVFYVVAKAMTQLEHHFPGIPDLYYAQRVGALVAAGKLESIGNLASMGRSEVWLREPDKVV